MTTIAKHNCEEEGKSDNSVKSRISLSVAGNSIGVDQELETFGKFVGAVECWRVFLAVDYVHERRNAAPTRMLKNYGEHYKEKN